MSRKGCREIVKQNMFEKVAADRSAEIKQLKIARLFPVLTELVQANRITPEEHDILKEALETLRSDGSEYEDL